MEKLTDSFIFLTTANTYFQNKYYIKRINKETGNAIKLDTTELRLRTESLLGVPWCTADVDGGAR